MIAGLRLPADLAVRGGSVTLRRATPADLDALIALLADDPVSASRGDRAAAADREHYRAALERIGDDDANEQLVVADHGVPVGMMQLTVIPGLARRGSTRLQVEAVRVRADRRSAGIGGAMMRWTTEVAARAVGASLVQLTSDARRDDAHRFYTGLGFVPSHVGFKLRLPPDGGGREPR